MPFFSLASRLFRRHTQARPGDARQPPAVPDHATGRIDIHCHLIPGVDDGCQSLDQTLACIPRLQAVGYTGSICTPHVWPSLFPDNTAANIRHWTDTLQQYIRDAGLDYQLWPGAELRLFDGLPDWLQTHETPTLAGSRFVLVDFWEPKWHDWVDDCFDWLLEHDYQPILAHPERLAIHDLPDRLDALRERGVLLQGNFRCLTGEDGFLADQWIRRFLFEDRYDFLALDVHRPDTLEARLVGLNAARAEFDADAIDAKTIDAPRHLILGLED
ncbi:MAG: CpsB/CapC family capsule biosynthesis tyrosine phosphatase [Phycisphaeraceae bacterium]